MAYAAEDRGEAQVNHIFAGKSIFHDSSQIQSSVYKKRRKSVKQCTNVVAQGNIELKVL